MTLDTLAAIRAIVAIHGGYGRTYLLTALDAAIEVARRTDQERQPDGQTHPR